MWNFGVPSSSSCCGGAADVQNHASDVPRRSGFVAGKSWFWRGVGFAVREVLSFTFSQPFLSHLETNNLKIKVLPVFHVDGTMLMPDGVTMNELTAVTFLEFLHVQVRIFRPLFSPVLRVCLT